MKRNLCNGHNQCKRFLNEKDQLDLVEDNFHLTLCRNVGEMEWVYIGPTKVAKSGERDINLLCTNALLYFLKRGSGNDTAHIVMIHLGYFGNPFHCQSFHLWLAISNDRKGKS